MLRKRNFMQVSYAVYTPTPEAIPAIVATCV